MSEVAKISTPQTRRSTLAISPEQAEFSREQVAALKKMNGWRDVPDAELSVFFHQAQRTGLDPFAKQLYLIGRRGKSGMQYTIQTSIDGMRLIADRTNRYAGSDRPRFGEEDGDRYAEVTVWKLVGNPATRVAFTGVAFESEFRDDRSPMWKKMPKTMLSKCAESVALRKAFPADLSGIYGQEEMEQAGPPAAEASVAPQQHSEVVEAEVVDQVQSEPLPKDEPQKLKRSSQELLRTLIEETGHSVEGFEEKIGPIASVSREVGEKWIERLREEHAKRDSEAQEAREADEVDSSPGTPVGAGVPDGGVNAALSDEEMQEIEDSIDKAQIDKGELPATRKQLNYLEALVADAEDGIAKFEEMVGKKVAELSREEASEWIGRLSGKAV